MSSVYSLFVSNAIYNAQVSPSVKIANGNADVAAISATFGWSHKLKMKLNFFIITECSQELISYLWEENEKAKKVETTNKHMCKKVGWR